MKAGYEAALAAKKARPSEDGTIPPATPLPIPPPQVITALNTPSPIEDHHSCRICGDNDPCNTTRQINSSHNSANCTFGRTSTRYDSAYAYVLSMTYGLLLRYNAVLHIHRQNQT